MSAMDIKGRFNDYHQVWDEAANFFSDPENFVMYNHTHTIEQVVGLVNILKNIQNELKNKTSGSIITRPSYLNFPPLGSQENLYVETSTNSIYRWDEKDTKYYILIRNFDDVEVISGGDSVNNK